MHFKCVDSALHGVDNGSQRICNGIHSIVKTLIMFNQMFNNGSKMFLNALAFFSNVLPCCNKAKHIVNTTNSTLFTSNKFN